jgi:hypothetical protein
MSMIITETKFNLYIYNSFTSLFKKTFCTNTEMNLKEVKKPSAQAVSPNSAPSPHVSSVPCSPTTMRSNVSAIR